MYLQRNRTMIQTCDMTYICLGDIQAVVVVYSPLNVHGCNFVLHMFIPLMWFHALQTEDLQVMLGQHTRTPSTNLGTTNQSTPLPRHLWLYGVGARRHLRWWLHDWLARQTLDLAEPCHLAKVTVGRGPEKHKVHWKSFKLYWHPWICAALAYVFLLTCIFIYVYSTYY